MYLLHILLSSIALYKIFMKCVNAAFQEEIEKCKVEDILSLFDHSITKSLIRLAGKMQHTYCMSSLEITNI